MSRMSKTVIAGVLCACAAVVPVIAGATGTARIQQPDGDVKIYKNVRIAIEGKQMSVTSADGVGTIVITKAGCSEVDKLIRCYPYEAVLRQHGRTIPITIVEGSAWLNPGTDKARLPNSTTEIGPRGVVIAVRTKKGTYMSLTGIADSVKK